MLLGLLAIRVGADEDESWPQELPVCLALQVTWEDHEVQASSMTGSFVGRIDGIMELASGRPGTARMYRGEDLRLRYRYDDRIIS